VLFLPAFARVNHQCLADAAQQLKHPRKAQIDPSLMERALCAYRTSREVYRQKRRVVVTYNENLLEGQVQGITRSLEKARRKLRTPDAVAAAVERPGAAVSLERAAFSLLAAVSAVPLPVAQPPPG
jgi:hypothetical protein